MKIFDNLSNLRHWFRISTGRNVLCFNKYFVKVHTDAYDALYEYQMLLEIYRHKPTEFRVPRAFKLLKTSKRNIIIMEHIKGSSLDTYILNFILKHDLKAIKIFYKIGKAVRELHYLPLSGLRKTSLPFSYLKLVDETIKLAKRAVVLGLLGEDVLEPISYIIRELNDVIELFKPVNLHGELYFSHVIISDGRVPVFIDFHNAQIGPTYFDLVMFSISLYGSAIFLPWHPWKLVPLIEAFLQGYFGGKINSELWRILAFAELYITLREILNYVEVLNHEVPRRIKLLNMIKIMRLKKTLSQVVLPRLIRKS